MLKKEFIVEGQLFPKAPSELAILIGYPHSLLTTQSQSQNNTVINEPSEVIHRLTLIRR